jgi:hypothetical protein
MIEMAHFCASASACGQALGVRHKPLADKWIFGTQSVAPKVLVRASFGRLARNWAADLAKPPVFCTNTLISCRSSHGIFPAC